MQFNFYGNNLFFLTILVRANEREWICCVTQNLKYFFFYFQVSFNFNLPFMSALIKENACFETLELLAPLRPPTRLYYKTSFTSS
jgi:hypothetical protein